MNDELNKWVSLGYCWDRKNEFTDNEIIVATYMGQPIAEFKFKRDDLYLFTMNLKSIWRSHYRNKKLNELGI